MAKEEILFSEEDIQKRVSEIAEELNEEYKDKDPVIIGLLTGSFMFVSDLLRQLDFPFEFDFLRTSGYGNSFTPLGDVILEERKLKVKDRDVIILDDILDTGKTMKELRDRLEKEGAKSSKIAVMFDKPARRIEDIQPDVRGFEVENKFLVGYGMNDENNRGRNLPYVYAKGE